MKAQDLMTRNPACAAPDTSLQEVARLMVECDCGEIPIVERETFQPVGVVTDRDITCRVVAQGRNPLALTAADCMSSPVVCVQPDDSLEDCAEKMQRNQVRRVLVVDSGGRCCGIIAQADLALTDKKKGGEVVRAVSRPKTSEVDLGGGA